MAIQRNEGGNEVSGEVKPELRVCLRTRRSDIADGSAAASSCALQARSRLPLTCSLPPSCSLPLSWGTCDAVLSA